MNNVRAVKRYYHTIESIVGYRFMVKGIKHYGYFPAGQQDISLKQAQTMMNDQVAKALALPAGSRVLEVGCGEGFAANYLAAHHSYEVTGVDLLPRNIARARQDARKLHLNTIFTVGDFMHLPFADASFDGVYGMETLVHAPDADLLFKELGRVVKPGGKLVFCEYSTVAHDKMKPEELAIVQRINKFGAMPALNQFITGTFSGLLGKANFRDVRVTNLTERVRPTARYFYERARRPMKIITKLHLENRFINAYSAYHSYLNEHLFRYNLVSAVRTGTKITRTGQTK